MNQPNSQEWSSNIFFKNKNIFPQIISGWMPWLKKFQKKWIGDVNMPK